MHPILMRIPLPNGGHFDIATYGVMLALGTLAGVLVTMLAAKRDGVSKEAVIDMAFWGVICGIAGAKAWFVVAFWDSFEDKWDLVRNFRSGLVYYGGLLGGIAGATGYLRLKRLPLLKTIDTAVPGAAIGLAFGRVGCFYNGCCYGALTNCDFGIRFPRIAIGDSVIGSPAYLDHLDRGLVTADATMSRYVYPSQLVACAGAALVFAALLLLRRKRKFYGEQTALLFVLYPVVRFAEELLRGDTPAVFLSLKAAQIASIALFLAGAAGLAYLRTVRPATLVLASRTEERAASRGPARWNAGKRG